MASEALEALRKPEARSDLSDVMMPDLDGFSPAPPG